ncbi:hypothetical protein [Chromobacterium sp. ATCC 53434]|nr:hypothetical protein [Chromobacterium sp. ATCC 53434]
MTKARRAQCRGLKRGPLGRPEELAKAAVFLASPSSSRPGRNLRQ